MRGAVFHRPQARCASACPPPASPVGKVTRLLGAGQSKSPDDVSIAERLVICQGCCRPGLAVPPAAASHEGRPSKRHPMRRRGHCCSGCCVSGAFVSRNIDFEMAMVWKMDSWMVFVSVGSCKDSEVHRRFHSPQTKAVSERPRKTTCHYWWRPLNPHARIPHHH